MTDIFQDIRDRLKFGDKGGEEPSDLSKREIVFVLDAAYQAATERDQWKVKTEEREAHAAVLATAKDNAEGLAQRAERQLSVVTVEMEQARDTAIARAVAAEEELQKLKDAGGGAVPAEEIRQ